MKKVILFAAILFAGVSVVKAEGDTAPSSVVASEKANVNLVLSPFHSIAVGTNEVNIIYNSYDHYNLGAESEVQADHLTVTSTGSFSITAQAEVLSVADNAEALKINPSILTIVASKGSTNGFENVSEQEKQLSNEGSVTLLSSDRAGLDKTFNVVYKGGSLKDLLNSESEMKYILSNNQTIYKTQVTYTLVPN